MKSEITFAVRHNSYKLRIIEEPAHFPATKGSGYRAQLIAPHGLIMEPHGATKVSAIKSLLSDLYQGFSDTDIIIAQAIEKAVDEEIKNTVNKSATNKKLTTAQIDALKALVDAGGSLRGRDGWANGNTVNKLKRAGLVSFVVKGWTSSITDKGRTALANGSYE